MNINSSHAIKFRWAIFSTSSLASRFRKKIKLIGKIVRHGIPPPSVDGEMISSTPAHLVVVGFAELDPPRVCLSAVAMVPMVPFFFTTIIADFASRVRLLDLLDIGRDNAH